MKIQVIILSVLLTVYVSQCDARPRRRGRKSDNVVDTVKDAVGKVVKDVADAGKFAVEAVKGAAEMGKAFVELRLSNHIGADKYFHAKGNYKAAKHGVGGKFAARVISDARETWQDKVSGKGTEDSQQDQAANRWGRNGGDPNKYRPDKLPPWYKK